MTIENSENRLTSAFIHSSYWYAFGDLLDDVFLPGHPRRHEIIKSEEGEYLKFYSFVELDKAGFNRAVRLIWNYIANLKKRLNGKTWRRLCGKMSQYLTLFKMNVMTLTLSKIMLGQTLPLRRDVEHANQTIIWQAAAR